MSEMVPGQALPTYEVIAHNYAFDADNRIHSDEGAASYGFAGGLVPGVGNYAYLTRPVVDALGREWLARGAMAAKFFHPVYHGERVCVRGQVASIEPLSLQLKLFNAAGTLCAIANASLPPAPPLLAPDDYPVAPLPASEARRAASLAAVPAGTLLGSLSFDWDVTHEEFLAKVVETAPIYREEAAGCHPAFYAAQANEILMQNVALGVWIHTATEAQHYTLARKGERLSLRGPVREAYERRGHEYVALDLGLFGAAQRPIAQIKHTAIIRLREKG
jgi:acyl dehydratase